jgi:hypothetical protein
MLDDIGAQTGFTHDGSDHELRLPLAALEADKSKYKGAKILLLVRDPRDTAVSGYFQVTRRLKLADVSISDILRDERHGLRKICHFNLQWFAAATAWRKKQFRVLSYEQMHQAPAAALGEVAAFAGVTLDPNIAELIASNRAFARLRAAEASGELAHRYGPYLLPGDRNDAESFKVRRGVIGIRRLPLGGRSVLLRLGLGRDRLLGAHGSRHLVLGLRAAAIPIDWHSRRPRHRKTLKQRVHLAASAPALATWPS